jgi:membrane protein implicated in regulation of membrane protease activity
LAKQPQFRAAGGSILNVHAWWVWLIIAAVFAAAELLSMNLVLVMLAAGSAAAGVAAYLGVPAVAQVMVAIAGSLALLLAVRPIAKQHLTPHSTLTGTEALVGRQAVVLSVVDANDGRVRLNGSEWSAKSFDPAQVIGVGSSVQVMRINGATAVVWCNEQ